MTDLLIKGMEMPIDGDYLFSFASDEKETICRIEKVSRDGSGTPIQYRMVVELPTHGRLIDAEELKELFRETITGIATRTDMKGAYEHMIRASAMVIDMIDDATTVIEASEGGEQDG